MGLNTSKDNFGRFLAGSLIIKINSKKFDVNGNAIFNVRILISSLQTDITNEFTSLTAQNKLLKNGTINIKDYKNIMIERIKIIAEKYNYSSIEVIEE